MAQVFNPITPTEVTPGTSGSWQDVNVSGSIASGATGVVLHCINPTGDDSLDLALRKNGGSDERVHDINNDSHYWAMIGVDGSRIFEAYVGSTDLEIWLVGYTLSGATFLTNGVGKTPGTANSWIDVDCSSEAPNAIGLIFEAYCSAREWEIGFRKNGSADDRWWGVWSILYAAIGCDASQITEIKVDDTFNNYAYLVGYITSGATFNTNATDLSLDSSGSWIDLSALPSGAVMGFIEVVDDGSSTNDYGLRKNGSAEDIYRRGRHHCWGFVECDANELIEGKIQGTVIDFFLVGYAEAEAPPPTYIPKVIFIDFSPISKKISRWRKLKRLWLPELKKLWLPTPA